MIIVIKKQNVPCNVKNYISLDKIEFDSKTLMKNFLDIKTITNIEIIKCYKTVFNKKMYQKKLWFFYHYYYINFIFYMYDYFLL